MKMHDSWFFDENFNGVPDNFFDDVFKSFDVPLGSVEFNEVVEDWDSNFKGIEPPPADILAGFSHNFSGQVNDNLKPPNNHSDLVKHCSATDKALTSGSTFTHESSADGKDSTLFQTLSPVSFLESSGSCSVENTSEFCPKLFSSVKRSRSKRPRPSFFNPHRSFPFMTSTRKSRSSAGLESDSEKYPVQRKHKKKLSMFSSSVKDRSSQQPNRKCSHCETTETPQWREGPMGPKTLCNACGVRYRSGRLVPEYRPASSPAFIPSLHSNSHRKIIEMWNKVSKSSYS